MREDIEAALIMTAGAIVGGVLLYVGQKLRCPAVATVGVEEP